MHKKIYQFVHIILYICGNILSIILLLYINTIASLLVYPLCNSIVFIFYVLWCHTGCLKVTHMVQFVCISKNFKLYFNNGEN